MPCSPPSSSQNQASQNPKSVSSLPTVAVIGGGLAGLASACALASSGYRVTLFERRPFLGGRASSYEHPGTGEVVDNCQHVLFGCCTNLIAFYRTIGIEDKIRWFDRMTFIEPGGRQSILEPGALPAPLHVMPSFLRFKFLNAKDKFALARALASLALTSPEDDGTSFQDWLARHHQTPAAIERFWKPILVSALSEDLDRISIPYAAQVVRETSKSRNARTMGVPTAPLTELYNSARDYIVSHGGEVRLRTGVQSFQPGDKGVRMRLQDSEEEFSFAVLAVPFDSLSKLLPALPESNEISEKLSHFETSPITGVHFWFDRPVTAEPFITLLDTNVQWVFNKTALYTDQSDAPVPGAQQYLQLVISASYDLLKKSREEIIELCLKEIRQALPAAREAQLVKATVIKEASATFSPEPGVDRFRPAQTTNTPGLFLAGDWTATGWPATMEGAVRSGYLAAEAVLRSAGSPAKFLQPDLAPTGLSRLFS